MNTHIDRICFNTCVLLSACVSGSPRNWRGRMVAVAVLAFFGLGGPLSGGPLTGPFAAAAVVPAVTIIQDKDQEAKVGSLGENREQADPFRQPANSQRQTKPANARPLGLKVQPRPQRGFSPAGTQNGRNPLQRGADRQDKNARDGQQNLDPTAPSPMADEINEIRRRIGGGVAESLEGMLDSHDQANMQRVFNEQLRKLDQQDRRTPPQFAAPRPGSTTRPNQAQRPQTPSSGQRPAAFSGRSPDRIVGYQPLGLPGIPVMANQGRVSVLRRSARQLDQAAADLEEIGEYRHADQLRSTADTLREQARRLSPNKRN